MNMKLKDIMKPPKNSAPAQMGKKSFGVKPVKPVKPVSAPKRKGY